MENVGIFVYFMTICNILWPFGIICGRLVLFVAIWYIFPILVCLAQEKSGNPGLGAKRNFKVIDSDQDKGRSEANVLMDGTLLFFSIFFLP
jgi:hypothetical protein